MTIFDMAKIGIFIVLCIWFGELLLSLVFMVIGGILALIGYIYERISKLLKGE